VYGELVLPDQERKEIIVRTDGRRPPGKGEVVHATVKEGHAHVFSPASGLRLSPASS
jgi:multiple sugar transport system ATP-binding protein